MGTLGDELRGPNSEGESTQGHGRGYGLRAVLDIQLAQNLLHVIFYRQRADLQDGSDLDVALAEMNPFQDFLLARGQNAGTCRMYGGGTFYRPVYLGAYPRLVQERHDQLDAIDLPRTQGLRPAGKNEEARGFPESIVGSMRDDGVRPYSVEFAPQRALGERVRAPCFADHRPVGVLLPRLDKVQHHGSVLAEQVAEKRGFDGRR